MKLIPYLIITLAPLSLFSASLNIGLLQEWDILHPISYQTAASESLMHLLQRQMVYRDASGQIWPEIAQEIPSFKNKKAKQIVINGQKKIQAQWALKKEAVWSDGTPITCQDWDFGWRVGMNDKVSKNEKSLFSKIESIKWVDAKICNVIYADSSWSFDRDLPPFLPFHKERLIYEKWGHEKPQAYEQNSNYVKAPQTEGLYSGPYQVQEIKLGQYIILKKNKNFWGEKPTIDQITIKFVTDSNLIKSYLLSGQINMVAPVGLPFDVALSVHKDLNDKFKVHFLNSFLYQGLFLNLENPLLQEQALRQALELSIDKDAITKNFFDAQVVPANSILWNEKKDLLKIKGDVAKANYLLDQAGWKKTTTGREKNGKKLILTFKTSSGLKVLENIQVYICDRFLKIGVQCNIKNEPARVFLGESVPHGDFDIGLFGNATLPDTSLKGLFSSAEIPTAQNAWAGGNIMRLKNNEVDQLLVQFDQESNASKREKLLQNLNNLIANNKWLIPLYHRKETAIVPNGFKGFENDIRSTALVYPERWRLN